MYLPLNIVRTQRREDLPDLFEKLQRGKLAIDTETTGLRWDRDRVGGLCLAAGQTAAYVAGDALGPAVRWLADQVKEKRRIVGHNLKYDMHMLRGTFGLNIMYPCDDTMVQSFLIDNRGAAVDHSSRKMRGMHGLKELATRYIDPGAQDAEKALIEQIKLAGGRGSSGRKKKRGGDDVKGDILFAPFEYVSFYGMLDAWYTLELDRIQIERLKAWQQPTEHYPSLWSLYETERWLLLALRDMEARGVCAQPEFFAQWRDDLAGQIEETHGRLAEAAGGVINWNSPNQLRELLYKKLKQPVTRWTKGGKKTGPMPSTDEVALLNLTHPVGGLLLHLRDLNKQHGTYAHGLLEAVWSDGKIHTSLRQIGADTGRLSSADPNLQQVPRESGARRGFVPEPGTHMRFADYSQVEMRFAAHFANDPTLVAGFLNDPTFDTHAATAKKMWGLHSDPSKQQRKFAKIMNFAMLYGAGKKKIASQLVALLTEVEARRSLKEFKYRPQPGEPVHLALADQLMSRYFAEFPSIKGASRRAQHAAEHRGFAMNAFGRHRYLEEGKEYTAFNTEIQGSAADAAKLGLVRMYRELQLNGGHIALLLQIHDEAVYLSDGDPKIDKQVVELLRHDHFKVPIIADVSGSTTTWQDKKELKLA